MKSPKFIRLNFNLKNEIFSFLSFGDYVTNISEVSKSFLYALNQSKILKFLKANLHTFIELVDFKNEALLKIKSKLSEYNSTSDSFSRQIFFYLLKLKFKNKSEIAFDEYRENYTLFDKFIFCQFLKASKNSIFKIKIFNKINVTNEIKLIYDAIHSNAKIEYLKLFSLQGLNQDDFYHLSNALQNKTNLKVLDLSFIYFSDKSKSEKNLCFKILFEGLINNNSLKNLYLGGCEIGKYNEDDFNSLTNFISINESLEEIELKGDVYLSKNQNFVKNLCHIFSLHKPNLKFVNIENIILSNHKTSFSMIFESLQKNKIFRN